MVKCVSKKKRVSKKILGNNRMPWKWVLWKPSLKKKAKKIKKPSRSKLIKKLDSVFSRYIRLRDSDSKWIVTCPLCGSRMHRKEAQNMHFISRWCYKFRWDETNCHAWDYRCNVLLKGNYIAYTRFMQNTYWVDTIDWMIEQSKNIEKVHSFEIEEEIENYTRLADGLERTKII